MSLNPAARPTCPVAPAPEWLAAAALSVMVVALHGFFLLHIGGLWQDEVTTVNRAQGPLALIAHDSFPILLPLLLRGWSWLGLGGADLPLRLFGVGAGLALTGAVWLAAWLTRRAPPLWSLALLALNAWVIYYSDALRAYGLGSALIAACAGLAWNYVERPGRTSWLLFAGSVLLSVQTLFQNSVLVAAICAGAWAVCWQRRSLRLAAGVLLAGAVGALSLLPYCTIIARVTQGAGPLNLPFDWMTAWYNLHALLAFPLRQYAWVWLILTAVVLVHGGLRCLGLKQADQAVFAAVAATTGTAFFFGFLSRAQFPIQPWYFLPLLALVTVCLEASLPRFGGRLRALLWGGLVATALIAVLFATKVLDCRRTNIDALARQTTALAQPADFVIVTPWHGGITFGRYFTGPCDWTTIPPIADHSCHRYDLLMLQMKDTNAMGPALDRMGAALRAGGSVWIVGGVGDAPSATMPPSRPPPPLPHTGWHETPYLFAWNMQMFWFLRQHSQTIECINPGTNENVNLNERLALFKASGWQETPPAKNISQ